ncbi:MAG: putative motility protein [Gammaproteobacteria bacterium SHHR-1]|uniref:putative motility protein n=1 Tax=Magnetovirga frankeli TaxID=947516 RepID=UPI001293412D|nr:putative motility protein [gamma proteobacterium SS-5]
MDATLNPVSSTAMSGNLQLQAAMLGKQKDVMEQQGQAALKLVDSAAQAAPEGNLGQNLNVYA